MKWNREKERNEESYHDISPASPMNIMQKEERMMKHEAARRCKDACALSWFQAKLFIVFFRLLKQEQMRHAIFSTSRISPYCTPVPIAK